MNAPLIKALWIIAGVWITAAAYEPGWRNYVKEYGKYYHSEEDEKMHLLIWRNVRDSILPELVQELKETGLSFTVGMNHIADLTHYQRSRLKGATPQKYSPTTDDQLRSLPTDRPNFINHGDSSCMPPIKNQGTACKSCWAFAATTPLEFKSCARKNSLHVLSEQNLLDCMCDGSNDCRGGWYTTAWDFIRKDKGICNEQSYPYASGNDSVVRSCRRDSCVRTGNNTAYVNVPQNEETMAKVVATVGPITVAIDADHMTFDFYQTGIYDDPKCRAKNANHAVVIVGYGTSSGGIDYWIVRNSWSAKWGENGYFRIKRGVNMCGIADFPFYPVI